MIFLNVIIPLEFAFIYLKIHSVYFGASLCIGTSTIHKALSATGNPGECYGDLMRFSQQIWLFLLQTEFLLQMNKWAQVRRKNCLRLGL